MKVSDPIMIRGKEIKNRLTMAPTVKFDYAGADGMATEKHLEHYRARAEHGCGLICVEATAVAPGGRFWKNHMGLWEDAQIPGHKAITNACHEFGAVVLIQLNHTGITSNPDCGPAIGPSAVPTRDPNVLSKEMSLEEIKEMQGLFLDAAVRAYQILTKQSDLIDEAVLEDAIRATFENRDTVIADNLQLFTDAFSCDEYRNSLWKNFLKKINWKEQIEFAEVMKVLQNRLGKYV